MRVYGSRGFGGLDPAPWSRGAPSPSAPTLQWRNTGVGIITNSVCFMVPLYYNNPQNPILILKARIVPVEIGLPDSRA